MAAQAVVFDWGGVLARADQTYLRELGAEIGLTAEGLWEVFSGPGGENSFTGQPFGAADLIPSMTRALSERLGDQALEVATRLCAAYGDPDLQMAIPEMHTLFTDLQDRGVPLAILSNAPREIRGPITALLGARLPEVLWVSGERGAGKPQRQAFEGIADELGLQPAACVFVDDSASHIAAAEAAGMRGLHFTGDVQEVRVGLNNLGLDIL